MTTVRAKRCPTCGGIVGAQQLPLTKTQARVLKLLGERIARDGFAPTLAEMCAHFGWASQATASEHVGRLEAKGYIRRGIHGEQRAITILVAFDEIGGIAVERAP
jgi:SOS-response transcriptional repressor LexA